MSAAQIDAAILSAVGERWTKVAMVIAKVADAMSNDLPLGDEGCQIVSRRIQDLVDTGHLQSQGNIENWRFSEIRQVGNDVQENLTLR